MKKVLTIIGIMTVMFSVKAQSFEKDYTYGFWSNWSIGGAPMMSKSINDNWTFGQGANVGIDIRFQKQVGQHWNLRLIGEIPGFMTSDTLQFDRYAKALVGFSWTPKNHFYTFLDAGLAAKAYNYGWLAVTADAGIGLKFDVYKHSTIFGELGVDAVADIKNDMTTDNAYVKVGYLYNFGITNVDRTILSQRKQLASETVVVVDNETEKRLRDCAEIEKILTNRIYSLEQHDSSLHSELSILKRENDSLVSVLKTFSENQINYYALPFSVQFDNDCFNIKTSEMTKIKAVANLMNSDTTISYTVSGFCDNTGSQEYNQKLSEKRAESVKYALMKYGVKEEQIVINGYGKDMPFGDSTQAINRRVSFYRNF